MTCIEVAFVDGRFALLILDPRVANEIWRTVAQADSAARWKGRRGVGCTEELRDAVRAFTAACDLAYAAVPVAEPTLVPMPDSAGAWMTTREFAEFHGITERAVRKRIAAGALPASKVMGRWLIEIKEAADAAA